MAKCPECNQTITEDGPITNCHNCGCILNAEYTITAIPEASANERVTDPQVRTIANRSPDTAITKRLNTIWSRSIHTNPNIDMTIKRDAGQAQDRAELTVKPRMFTEVGHSSSSKEDPDYELLGILGEGGMGIVYSARQTSINRAIAIKMIKGDRARNPESKAKFLSEAAIHADLDHPNITPVYELGADYAGGLFYAMKQVQGREWAEIINNMPLSKNLDILMRVADAVAFAHSRNIIHQDLKPENVMLGEFGEVLLMDWGLAAKLTEDKKHILESSPMGGTPAYMAPEMARGYHDRIAAHSDVYLLGGILYEIVTGLRPHTGESYLECLYNIAENVIQPTEESGELIDIAMTAMGTAPEHRYASVKDFQQAIHDYEAHLESIVLCDKATLDLEKARRRSNYEVFAQAVFGFKQAWELWEDNYEAKKGLRSTQLEYAKCAMTRGDLDLAASLLDEGLRKHRKLAQKVKEAQNGRSARQKKIKVLTYGAGTLAAVILVLSLVGFFWIRSEQGRTNMALLQAQEEQQRAVEAERKAQIETARALHAERLSLAQKQHAEHEFYKAGIAEADKLSASGNMNDACNVLQSLPREFRNWEYYHLLHRCRTNTYPKYWEQHIEAAAVAFSPDGKRVACGDVQGRVGVWTVTPCKRLFLVQGHAKRATVRGLAFSPDGMSIVSGGEDSTTRVYDSNTGRIKKTLMSHRSNTNCVAFSPDGSVLATGYQNGIAILWNTKTWAEIHRFPRFRHARGVHSAIFSPDGKHLVTNGEYSVVIYDVKTGKKIRSLPGYNCSYTGTAFSPDGKRLATAWNMHSRAKIWDMTSGKELVCLRGHSGGITSIKYSPDGKYVATSGFDSTVRTWNAQTGQQLAKLAPGNNWVSSVDVSPDGEYLASAHVGARLILWKTFMEPEFLELKGQGGSPRTILFSTDSKQIITSAGYRIKIWDSITGKCTRTLITGREPGHIALSPDQTLLASTSLRSKDIKLWDMSSGKRIAEMKGHENSVLRVGFNSDNNKLLSASNKAVKEWTLDTKEGKTVDSISGILPTLGPKGEIIAVISKGIIHVRNLKTAKVILEAKVPSTKWHIGPSVIAFNQDASSLAVGEWNSCMHVWNIKTGKKRFEVLGKAGRIISIAFAPDGKRLAASTSDGAVHIWDTERGRVLLTLEGIGAVVFSSDGKRLATGSESDSIRIWETEGWPDADSLLKKDEQF